MAHLSLKFLGGFDVMLDAQPVTTFGAGKARALLAFLAIESSRSHQRAKLAAMFWPDLPEKKAAHNLSQSLLRIRKALQEKERPDSPPFLIVSAQDIQFNQASDYKLDVERFYGLLNLADQHQHPKTESCEVCVQWLSRVAELYRGQLLTGLFVPDSVVFEEWRLVQQEELHRKALETLSLLANYHEQRGEYERVQDYALRQITLEPWRDEAHLQLMRALVQSGQASVALRQYELYRHTLDEELANAITHSIGVLLGIAGDRILRTDTRGRYSVANRCKAKDGRGRVAIQPGRAAAGYHAGLWLGGWE